MATSLAQLDSAIADLVAGVEALIAKVQAQTPPPAVDYTAEVTQLQTALANINAVLNPPAAS